jgi:HEPN domain-containing protein
MKIDDQIKYWVELAENDLPVAQSMLENGHYSWSLFIGHLVLEKILKAIYVRDNLEAPPKTHDLVKLSKSTKLKLNKEQEDFLNYVTGFNIEARYTDYKSKFYKLCTKDFTEENLSKIKETFKWLKSQLK